MLALFNWLWAAPQVLPEDPEVIIPLGYACWPGYLSRATEAGIRDAITFAHQSPHAVVSFADGSHCFIRSDQFELTAKSRMLLAAHVPFAPAGPVTNTIGELQAIAKKLREEKIEPREVLLIVDMAHSRRVRYIARRLFPQARISLMYLHEKPYQKEQLFFFLRGGWRWLFANIVGMIPTALWALGLQRASLISEPKF